MSLRRVLSFGASEAPAVAKASRVPFLLLLLVALCVSLESWQPFCDHEDSCRWQRVGALSALVVLSLLAECPSPQRGPCGPIHEALRGSLPLLSTQTSASQVLTS